MFTISLGLRSLAVRITFTCQRHHVNVFLSRRFAGFDAYPQNFNLQLLGRFGLHRLVGGGRKLRMQARTMKSKKRTRIFISSRI